MRVLTIFSYIYEVGNLDHPGEETFDLLKAPYEFQAGQFHSSERGLYEFNGLHEYYLELSYPQA